MPKIVTERVPGLNEQGVLWKVSVRWDADTVLVRWGQSLSEAMRKLAALMLQMEQVELANKKLGVE